VLGVLFESLSPEVYSSIYARESRIENWRRQEDLVSIWAKIVEIYSAGEVIFPELWKIDALALCIVRKEETLAEFWNKRDRLFGELEVKNIHVSNSEKKFSLLRGLKSDRCFRESIEPYFTQVKKLPGSYEGFKDEVLR